MHVTLFVSEVHAFTSDCISGVYDSLRAILNDGKLDVRVQYMIEVMFAIRKDGFKVCRTL